MRIPIPPPPLPKVFSLTSPWHLLTKLHWEISGFKRAESRGTELGSPLVIAYHAMNCAITAWHMTDWIWNDGDDDGGVYLADALGLKKADQASFEAYVRNESRAINCCRDIATGSKHMKLKRGGGDPSVKAEVAWSYEDATVESTVEDSIGWHRPQLVIHDRHGQRPAREVFEEAFDYWGQFLRSRGFIEDRLIVGYLSRPER